MAFSSLSSAGSFLKWQKPFNEQRLANQQSIFLTPTFAL
jgi:hypothetical protein